MCSKFFTSLVLLLSAAAAQAEVPGRVHSAWVYMALDAQGNVRDMIVIDQLDSGLTRQIEDWVRSSTFPPAMLDGEPVRSTTPLRITYELEEPGSELAFKVLEQYVGPRPTLIVEPRYPRGAAVSGEPGRVTLEFRVQPSGKVSDIKVVDSSDRAFNRYAVAAVRKWEFQTRTVNGQPVGDRVQQTIEFEIE
jgi:TonB family protein